jgi:hypothetical protein
MRDFPSKMVFDKEISKEAKTRLQEAYNLFCEIRDKDEKIISKVPTTENGQSVFEKGTLLHGMVYDEEKIKSIARTGIVASEFFGVAENNDETYYCADFFKVTETQTVEQYVAFVKNQFGMEKQRLPIHLEKTVGSNIFGGYGGCMAFVIDPNNPQIQQLLEKDSYTNADIETEFNHNLLDKRERLSAILCGIPSNYISSILVSNQIAQDKSKIDFLTENLNHCNIVSTNGSIVYKPTKENENENDFQMKI